MMSIRVKARLTLIRLIPIGLAFFSCVLTPSEEQKVLSADAYVVDLSNAACTAITAIDPALPYVMLACDVIDAGGALIAHYVGNVPTASAIAILQKHPAPTASKDADAPAILDAMRDSANKTILECGDACKPMSLLPCGAACNGMTPLEKRQFQRALEENRFKR